MNYLTAWIMASLVFFVDRVSKYLVVTYLHNELHVTSFFSLEKTFNRGISWGLFSYTDSLSFVVISFLVLLVYILTCYVLSDYLKGKGRLPFFLIAAGGLSNIIDRIWYGGVVDFISFSYAGYAWPTFNIADCAIVVGGFLFIGYIVSSYEYSKTCS